MEARQDWCPGGRGYQERQAGETLREEGERSGGRLPGPLGPGSLLSSQAGTPPAKAPSRTRGFWEHKREAGEIRRGRQEEPSRGSGRGAEGNCPTHLGTGSLLSSQADPLPSKPHPGCVGPWGHMREAGEIRGGREEGPCRRSRTGEQGICHTHSSPGRLIGSQVRSPAL